MAKKKEGKKANKLLLCARILAILFIAFISIFALDIFSMNLGFWGTILGLFMHLIPSLILVAVLAIAWKKPFAGGIIFILMGLSYALMTLGSQLDWRIVLSWSSTIAAPAITTGILFVLGSRRKK